MSDATKLSVSDLQADWLPDELPFETTAELRPAHRSTTQPRVMEALGFGLSMETDGYNIFAVADGTEGIRETIASAIEAHAADRPTPGDWCYVHNFDREDQPVVLRFPAGRGTRFARDVDQLLDDLKEAIPTAFESEEYEAQRELLTAEFQTRQQERLGELREAAQARNIAMIPTPTGVAFAPTRDGEIIPPDQFQQMDEQQRQQIFEDIRQLEEQFGDMLEEIGSWSREQREKLRQLNEDLIRHAVGERFAQMRRRYDDVPAAIEHLEAVEEHVIRNAFDFVVERRREEEAAQSVLIPFEFVEAEGVFERYRVNVIVDNADRQAAPVIYEPHPTWENLVGKIDYEVRFGALITNFRQIRAGCLHEANGGYLVLEADKVLGNFGAWGRLKRALRTSEVRIEQPESELGLRSPFGMEPQAIELDVKVILIGQRRLLYLLEQLDPEFDALFRVVADFDEELDRSVEIISDYLQVLAGLCRREGLPDFDREAVDQLLKWSARRSEDRQKLTADIDALEALMQEAGAFARRADRATVAAAHVIEALEARRRRRSRIRERVKEAIHRGVVLIDTEGERTGQINGLSVLDIGGDRFGKPSRITAQARLGDAGIIDIEREVELGGPIHSKGVMILGGYLGGRHASRAPLSLSASLVFEQSYGGVEGDSASLAELCALLSELAEAPVAQNLAVTGSLNQKGDVQPVGGINEKIEGFFEVCRQKGLTGKQGVIIPKPNVQHLVLHPEVIQAVADETFTIHAVDHIDQAIEQLTGLSAGEANEEGEFPADSVNGRVAAKLQRFAERARQMRGPIE